MTSESASSIHDDVNKTIETTAVIGKLRYKFIRSGEDN